MRIDQNGEPQGILDRGQRKSLQTDRVILVPGSEEEVKTVRWMYREFIDGGRLEGEIAALLNERGIETDLDRPWTRGTVHQVLTNEKYIGNNVFNRHSYKLKYEHRNNPPEEWVRANGAFEAIVDTQLFFTAQGMIRERNRRFSDDQMIDRLERLLKKKGFLSGFIIDEADDIPSSGCYASRFGSLARAYSLVGFTPDRDCRYIEINRTLRRIHASEVARAIAEIEELGGAVSQDAATDLLTVNGEFTASIVVARCRPTKAGSPALEGPPRHRARPRPDGRSSHERLERSGPRLLPPAASHSRLEPHRARRRKRPDAGCLPVRHPGPLLRHGEAGPDFGDSNMTDTDDTDTIAIETIPIERIAVLNPRVRDARKFAEIVDSIRQVGLKQPIKVSRTRGADGEVAYNLVCGQGRMEAFQALEQTEIPAIVTDLSEEDSLVSSLVEKCRPEPASSGRIVPGDRRSP